MAPAYIPDEELAKYPIIVVAKWEKATFKSHNRTEHQDIGEVVTACEAFTDLNVLEAIRGDVKPGIHTLKVGWGIGWTKDGRYVNSATSTELHGDVDDITVPNLWFLQNEKSWDEKDKTNYLGISYYRSIQPLALKTYFSALASAQPDKEVPKLLASDTSEVVRRALRYVCGGIWPWPYDADFEVKYLNVKKQRKALRSATKAVASVIERKKLNDVRPQALTVYAELEGRRCVPLVRSVLTDENPEVRAMAIAILAHLRDGGSVEHINQVVDGTDDSYTSITIVRAIADWGEPRLVPSLVAFLENGKRQGEPAQSARDALHSITGHWFPFDVESSRQAWAEVSGIKDTKKRKQQLASLLPCDPSPLKAELIGNGTSNALIRVTNKSAKDVTITRSPSWISLRSASGVSDTGFVTEPERAKEDFVVLRSGEFITFDSKLLGRFHSGPSPEVKVAFWNSGRPWHLKAWMGWVTVEPGTNWKEERKLENVEQRWPNGNFKAKGQKLNGKEYGKWEYFNEEGDRIKTVNYTIGGTAECNPDHPDNKGAGRRQE